MAPIRSLTLSLTALAIFTMLFSIRSSVVQLWSTERKDHTAVALELEIPKCALLSNASEMQQTIRELRGKVSALEGTAHAKLKNTIQTEAELWADTVQLLQRPAFNCIGPPSSLPEAGMPRSAEEKIWEQLKEASKSGNICGCLIPFTPRRHTAETCKGPKRPKDVFAPDPCLTLWIMTVGDSTMMQWVDELKDIIQNAGFEPRSWKSSKFDDNEIKASMTKLRKTVSTSGRLGVHLSYEDDFLFVHKVTGRSILLSGRTAMGMSLSKWMATLEKPLMQHQVPHIPGGGSIVQHPSLDEPYFVQAGSQALDFLHEFCGGDFLELKERLLKNRRPDFIVGGSALWDTGADSNMQHRNEVHRCGMKLPVQKEAQAADSTKESMVISLYRRRLYNLFNYACDLYGSEIFTWRLSGLGPRTFKGKTLPDDIINYAETQALNRIARDVANEFGVPLFDYEALHRRFGFIGEDAVHPAEQVAAIGVREWLAAAMTRSPIHAEQRAVVESLIQAPPASSQE